MPTETFTIDDDDRYARLKLISWWKQERLQAAKVLVVGAGALGNEVLKNLALLGVGNIWIVDFDAIETSNLTRSVLFRASDRGKSKAAAAAAMLQEINPDCRVVARQANIITDIGMGLFHDMDVVIGCLDNREARLWVNRQCWKTSTPWVDGGIQEISGVVKVFQPPHSACYECAMTENDYRLMNLRYSCPLLSREEIMAGRVPTAPTISSIIAGFQTQESLKLLHGMEVSAGKALVFNGVTNHFYTTQLPFKEECLSHETWPDPIELPLSATIDRAQDLFALARPHFSSSGELELTFERDLVVSLDCAHCQTSRNIMRVQQLVRHQQAQCECGHLSLPVFANSVSENEAMANETLATLGIPPYDIVRVICGEEERMFLLADDRAAVES
jgi:molybdopterin-synthase adenylyltransferase